MKLFMTFLLVTFVLAVLGADRPARRHRVLPLLAVCVVVSIGFTARRFI